MVCVFGYCLALEWPGPTFTHHRIELLGNLLCGGLVFFSVGALEFLAFFMM